MYREKDFVEADPIGTVPAPGTLKGVAKTGLQKLMGNQPEVLLDKLAGRLAFERTGTRLYDALLGKCAVRLDEGESLPLDQLRTFRDEEAAHFALVWEAMRQMGADPTAQTPEADVNGVASMGLMQVIVDPRTTLAQSLHAMHIAELTDRDGWDMLTKLARDMGHTDMASTFEAALADEARHLETIRRLMQDIVMVDAAR